MFAYTSPFVHEGKHSVFGEVVEAESLEVSQRAYCSACPPVQLSSYLKELRGRSDEMVPLS